MANTPRPKKHQNDIQTIDNEDRALKFIEGAGKVDQAPEPTIPEEPAKAAKKGPPKPIIIRGIDDELLSRLEGEAKRRRVSRSALIRMLLVEHLPE